MTNMQQFQNNQQDTQNASYYPNPYHNMQYLQKNQQETQNFTYHNNFYNSLQHLNNAPGSLAFDGGQNEQSFAAQHNNTQIKNFKDNNSPYASQNTSLDATFSNQTHPIYYQNNSQIASDNIINTTNDEQSHYRTIRSLTNYYANSSDLQNQNDMQTYLNPYHNNRNVPSSLGAMKNFSPNPYQLNQPLLNSFGNENLNNINSEQYSANNYGIYRNLENNLQNCLLPKAYINSRLLQSTNWLQKPFFTNFLSSNKFNSPLHNKFKMSACNSNIILPILKQCLLRGLPNPYYNAPKRHAVYA